MEDVNHYSQWHVPIAHDHVRLSEAIDSMQRVGAGQQVIPLMVQLVENPNSHIPGFTLFHGAVDLAQHDCIHIVLGRGLLEMDEAFTIGFTMGSTNKVSTTEERLFSLVSKYLYPQIYQFSEDDIAVFRDAVRLGYISSCLPLDEVDFSLYDDWAISDVREALGLEPELLRAYFAIERTRYPQSVASQRLLNP